MPISKELSYEDLDDLTQLPAEELDAARSWFERGVGVKSLGPMVELVAQRALLMVDLPFVATNVRGPAGNAIVSILQKGVERRLPVGASLEPLEVEVCGGLGVDAHDADSLRIAYYKRAERAAFSAGFTRKIAAGLSGAMQEMADNIIQHSERIDSGLIGYRWSHGEFEFVVSDSGVGVLNSLRKCHEHSSLADHGTAIRLALNGQSRFGIGQGHGFGFRQLFISLAELQGSLRFRSGDHSVEIDGTSPDVATARTIQRSPFQGFMMSAVCRPKIQNPKP